MASEIEIKGLPELYAKLSDAPNRIHRNVLRTSVFRAAQLLRDILKGRAPLKTGALVKSIKARRSRGDKFTEAAKVEVGEFYAKFLEYGTSKMAAKPFVRPAFEVTQEQLVEELVRTIGPEIERQLAKK